MTGDAVRKQWLIALIAVPLLVSLAVCSGDDIEPGAATTTPASNDAATTLRERLDLLDSLVTDWRQATTIEDAHAAAEAAANLIVGPGGPNYGDRDANGTIEGATEAGVLPGLVGAPTGLANSLDNNECIVADVLGGTWDDPAARWTTMLTAIDEWRPAHNTMPTLPSHPMRVVGWATFTLASDSLEAAHEYAGHAQLHVNVSIAALDC